MEQVIRLRHRFVPDSHCEVDEIALPLYVAAALPLFLLRQHFLIQFGDERSTISILRASNMIQRGRQYDYGLVARCNIC